MGKDYVKNLKLIRMFVKYKFTLRVVAGCTIFKYQIWHTSLLALMKVKKI